MDIVLEEGAYTWFMSVLKGVAWECKGLAHAVAYLHHDCSSPIIHRDISLNNILLEGEYELRLSYFGTARLLNLNSSHWTTIASSYGYIALG
ncbi:hypothetical protein Gotur_000101 [Gossypium turneri]